jgi:ribonuclease BN (tRNA processing enzyme)
MATAAFWSTPVEEFFLRFGEADAALEDLNLIALTHFHADHVADIPALVKAGFFSDRTAPLPISGVSKGGEFPGLKRFLASTIT